MTVVFFSPVPCRPELDCLTHHTTPIAIMLWKFLKELFCLSCLHVAHMFGSRHNKTIAIKHLKLWHLGLVQCWTERSQNNLQHPPCFLTDCSICNWFVSHEIGSMTLMDFFAHILAKAIRCVICRVCECHIKEAFRSKVNKEAVLHINVTCPLIAAGILRHEDGSHVVNMNCDGSLNRNAKWVKNLHHMQRSVVSAKVPFLVKKTKWIVTKLLGQKCWKVFHSRKHTDWCQPSQMKRVKKTPTFFIGASHLEVFVQNSCPVANQRECTCVSPASANEESSMTVSSSCMWIGIDFLCNRFSPLPVCS